MIVKHQTPSTSDFDCAIEFGDLYFDKYVETKNKLKEAEDTLAMIDFDVFAMEADHLKLQSENEALKTEVKRLQDLLNAIHTYVDCR